MLKTVDVAEEGSESAPFLHLLEIINSCRSTPADRVKGLLQLEQEFSKVLLSSNVPRAACSAWWDSQRRPQSCIALSLIALLHRLHIEYLASGRSSQDTSQQRELVFKQYLSCFTILQGLCLKDKQSQQICSTRSTLELILDIIDASYWSQLEELAAIPTHAIDLLICITVSTSSASHLVDTLQGEEIIRALMERQTFGEASSSSSSCQGRRLVTLAQMEDNPVAVKCAEFLLFFEYEREGRAVDEEKLNDMIGNDSTLISDTFRKAVKKTHREKTGGIEAVKQGDENQRRARSTSPRKKEREHGINSKALQTKINAPFQRTSLNVSPTKTSPPLQSKKEIKSGSSPFDSKAAIIDKPQERGRSRNRSPLIETQPLAASNPSISLPKSSSKYRINASVSSMHSSPLKALIGPSPAVQRAQARSVSPIKRKPKLDTLKASLE